MLARLAFNLDLDVKRDKLIDVLWPDSDIDNARHSLAQALSSLRRQLEPPDLPKNSVLLADHTRIRLLADAVSTDLQRFASSATLAIKAPNSHDKVDLWQRAITRSLMKNSPTRRYQTH